MPRETKEQKELNIDKKEIKKTATKTTKATKKTVATKPKEVKKSVASSKKKATTKKSSTAKKATTKATTATKTTKSKSTATKKATSKKVASTKTKKSSSKKAVSKTITKTKPEVVEYYDLPYRYNQTVVKLLAQTPSTLFVYWDISDEDRENYKKQYGENFFETTKPVLIVHNDTLDYSFEVDINDFANSWYLQVNDSRCDYRIELGRRPITYSKKINTDYIFVSESNEIESPNDRILLDKFPRNVTFRNLKTKKEFNKTLSDMSIKNSLNKIYNIYDLYKLIFDDENIDKFYNLSNPSSGNPSSGSLTSSKFK